MAEGYKIIPGGGKETNLPNGKALKDMLDTISTPEAAYYAQVAAAKRFSNIGNDEVALKVIKKIADFASNVDAVNSRQTTGTEWKGVGEPPSQFQSLQQFLADQSVENVKQMFKEKGLLNNDGELIGELELDFAANDKAQFVRAYKLLDKDGKPLEGNALKDMQEMLDDTFKAWAAENGMFYKKGQFYEIDAMGIIKKGQNEQDILMQKEELFRRLQDKDRGFAAYMKQQGVQSKVVRRAFPESETEADRQADVQDAIQHGRTGGINEIGAENTPGSEPEQPTGPVVGG